MAEDKADKAQTRVTQPATEGSGVEHEQHKPSDDMSVKEREQVMTFPEDKELHPAGVVEDDGSELEKAPFRTTRPNVPIIHSVVTGPGAHVPPPKDEFLADGRLRDLPR